LMAAVGLGCDGLLSTEPDTPPLLIERALSGAAFGAPRTVDSYVDVSAYLDVGDEDLASHERVRMLLTTSAGDSEELSVGPGVCMHGSARAICREYVAMISNPSQFASVAATVDLLGARMNRIGSSTSQFAVIYVFAEGEALVRQQIATLAGISSLEPNHLVSVSSAFPAPEPPQLLHAAIKVNSGGARVAGDGILTIQIGDVITLTYPGVAGTPQTMTRTVVE
jgi:hypothetical protein